MKSIAKLSIVVICFLMSFSGKTITKSDSIKLSGLVFNNKHVVKQLTIKVYDHNKLIKKVYVARTNRFQTNIPINSNLTIEISAPEYHTKRFIFNSKVPDRAKKPLKYHFDIDIFKESELDGVNTSLLDFPVGMVSYDSKKGEFVRNKKYTKKMKKDYLKLWAESQAASKQGKGLD